MANFENIIQEINTNLPDNNTQSITAKKLRDTLIYTLYGTEEEYDISANNNGTKYANLTAALGTNGINVPSDIRKGGMVIRFVNSTTNKYEQYRYLISSITNSDFANTDNWQNVDKGVDDKPTAGSKNLVESGGVYSTTPSIGDSSANSDLDFSDEDGNIVMRLANGHIITKNFDSSNIEDVYNNTPYITNTSANSDLDFSDEDGNVLMRLSNGHIMTKNFDSSNIEDILFNNIFKNKRLSFIGDSITTFADYPGSNNPFYTGHNAGITNVYQTWWGGLCQKCGATINRIYAYGGGDIVGRLCLQYDKLFSEGSTGTAPDYIFILGGINDWYHGRDLGTLEDNEAPDTTFYAAYKYLIKNLKITYPNATIICLSMFNSMIFDNDNPPTNNNQISLRKFCEAVIQCAKYYSVPHLDLNCLVNININNYTRILADKTHPNYIGAELITNTIIRNVQC